jgi:hypothetical protein
MARRITRSNNGGSPWNSKSCAHAVFTHVRSHRHGIGAEAVEQGGGIATGSVADVAALRIGNDKAGLRDVRDDARTRFPTRRAVGLEEGEVRLECYRGIGRGRHNFSAERLHAGDPAAARGGDALRIRVEADAEVRTARSDGR